MLKSLLPYAIDWLCSSTTLASELTCPECLAQLAPSGRLTVIEPTIMETEEAMVEQFAEIDKADGVLPKTFAIPATGPDFPDEKEEPMPKVGTKAYVCEVCGKSFDKALALNGHSRSHKEK